MNLTGDERSALIRAMRRIDELAVDCDRRAAETQDDLLELVYKRGAVDYRVVITTLSRVLEAGENGHDKELPQ